MSARHVAAAALALLAACGNPAPPPGPGARPAPAAPDAAGPALPDPASAKPSEPEWSYTSVGRRDPFRSFMADVSSQAGMLATRCATPLGRYEIEQLRLVAVITGLEDPVAMVEAPNGVGYSLRRGACVRRGSIPTTRRSPFGAPRWVGAER